MFLNDKQLKAAVKATPGLVTGFPGAWEALDIANAGWDSSGSPIQPCSIDLHVGEIFVPGVVADAVGSVSKGKTAHSLESGRSVVVQSLEKLCLPDDVGAIALPPSRISSKGIFIANFGHVDPGYEGHMRFTLINMGKEPYLFSKGDDVITILFFRIEKTQSGWKVRNTSARAITQDEVNVLAEDFGDMDARVTKLVKRLLGESGWRYLFVNFVGPILVAGVLYVLSIYLFFQGRVDGLVISTNKLEATTGVYDGRMTRLEKAQDNLETARTQEREALLKRLSDLEDRLKSIPQGGK
jgi:deoxycytidine triphosphate deaminase